MQFRNPNQLSICSIYHQPLLFCLLSPALSFSHSEWYNTNANPSVSDSSTPAAKIYLTSSAIQISRLIRCDSVQLKIYCSVSHSHSHTHSVLLYSYENQPFHLFRYTTSHYCFVFTVSCPFCTQPFLNIIPATESPVSDSSTPAAPNPPDLLCNTSLRLIDAIPFNWKSTVPFLYSPPTILIRCYCILMKINLSVCSIPPATAVLHYGLLAFLHTAIPNIIPTVKCIILRFYKATLAANCTWPYSQYHSPDALLAIPLKIRINPSVSDCQPIVIHTNHVIVLRIRTTIHTSLLLHNNRLSSQKSLLFPFSMYHRLPLYSYNPHLLYQFSIFYIPPVTVVG